jgi:hypothetical protein
MLRGPIRVYTFLDEVQASVNRLLLPRVLDTFIVIGRAKKAASVENELSSSNRAIALLERVELELVGNARRIGRAV